MKGTSRSSAHHGGVANELGGIWRDQVRATNTSVYLLLYGGCCCYVEPAASGPLLSEWDAACSSAAGTQAASVLLQLLHLLACCQWGRLMTAHSTAESETGGNATVDLGGRTTESPRHANQLIL